MIHLANRQSVRIALGLEFSQEVALGTGEVISRDTAGELCSKEKVERLSGRFGMTSQRQLKCAFWIGWIFHHGYV